LYEDPKNRFTSIAFSEDGKSVALGDYAGNVELREMATMKKLKTIAVITKEDFQVRSIALHTAGHLVASGDSSGHISIHNIDTCAQIMRHQVEGGGLISSLTLSSSGDRLAAVTLSEVNVGRTGARTPRAEIIVLDVKNEKNIFGTGLHGSWPSLGMTQACVAYRPDGTLMVAGETSGAVAEFPNGRSTHYVSVETFPFNPDFSVTPSNSARCLLSLPRYSSITAMGLSRYGYKLAIACRLRYGENEVRFLNLLTTEETNKIALGQLDDGIIFDVKFAPDGMRFAAGYYGLRFWDVGANHEPIPTARRERSSRIAISGNAERVAVFEKKKASDLTINQPDEVEVWSAINGKSSLVLGPKSSVVSMGHNTDGSVLAIGSLDGNVMVSYTDRGSDRLSFKAHEGSVSAVAVDRAGERIATSTWKQQSNKSELRLWVSEGGKERLIDTEEYDGEIARLAFDASGARLAIAFGRLDAERERFVDGNAWVRVITSNQSFGPFPLRTEERALNATPLKPTRGTALLDPAPVGVYPGSGLTTPTLSHDGHLLAFGGAVWNVDVQKVAFAIEGNPTCFAFSQDGRRLASGDWYGAVRVWDVRTGEETLALQEIDVSELGQVMIGVGFSDDGRRLIGFLQNAIVSWNTADRADQSRHQNASPVLKHQVKNVQSGLLRFEGQTDFLNVRSSNK